VLRGPGEAHPARDARLPAFAAEELAEFGCALCDVPGLTSRQRIAEAGRDSP